LIEIVCADTLGTGESTMFPVPASNCNIPCTGNATQTCGGQYNFANVYEAPGAAPASSTAVVAPSSSSTPVVPPSSSVSPLDYDMSACVGSSFVISFLGSGLVCDCGKNGVDRRLGRREEKLAGRIGSEFAGRTQNSMPIPFTTPPVIPLITTTQQDTTNLQVHTSELEGVSKESSP